MSGEASGKTNKSKKNVKNISDDEYLNQCIKENDECSADTCNKSIKLIRLQCNLCTKFFCTTHALPEVHGCGMAAKKAAAIPVRKPLNEEKTQKLEKKLTNKLNKMQNERKKKGK